MTETTVDRDPFEVVAESFLARFRAGERPSIEDLAACHPELADQIRAPLPALVVFEQIAGVPQARSAKYIHIFISDSVNCIGRRDECR
jgi:hypothetical protein